MPAPNYSPLPDQTTSDLSGRHSAPPHHSFNSPSLPSNDQVPLSRTPDVTLPRSQPSSRPPSSSRPHSSMTSSLPLTPLDDSSDPSDHPSHRLIPLSTPSSSSPPPPRLPSPYLNSSPTAHLSLMNRLTVRLVPFLFGVYLFSFIDRFNLGNIKKDLLSDIHMTEAQYGWTTSVFFIPYVIGEIPSNALLSHLPNSGHRFLARIIFLFGLVSFLHVWADSYAGLLVLRFLLGVAEAGLFPGLMYYASLWYAPRERAERLSYIYLAQPLAGLVGSAIAAVVLKTLEGVLGLRAWRWLFIVEGIPSMALGVACWFWLPAGPAHASWLTEEERTFLVQRHQEALEDKRALQALNDHRDGVEAAVHGGGKVDRMKDYAARLYRSTFSNRLLWLCALMNWLCLTPVQSVSFYLPSIISDHGLDQLTGNLLSLPIYLTASVFMVALAIHSDRTHERYWHVLTMNIVGGVGLLFTAIAMSSSEGINDSADLIALQVMALTVSAIGVWASKPPAMALYLSSVPGDLAVAIATVTTVGNVSGITAPLIMAYLRESSGNYVSGCLFLMACLLAASGVITWIRRELRRVEGVRVYEKLGHDTEMQRDVGLGVDRWQSGKGQRGEGEVKEDDEKVSEAVAALDVAISSRDSSPIPIIALSHKEVTEEKKG